MNGCRICVVLFHQRDNGNLGSQMVKPETTNKGDNRSRCWIAFEIDLPCYMARLDVVIYRKKERKRERKK